MVSESCEETADTAIPHVHVSPDTEILDVEIPAIVDVPRLQSYKEELREMPLASFGITLAIIAIVLSGIVNYVSGIHLKYQAIEYLKARYLRGEISDKELVAGIKELKADI